MSLFSKSIFLSVFISLFGGVSVRADSFDKIKVNGKYIELVIYRPKKGVSSNELNKLALKLNDFLKNQEGFIFRDYGVTEDGVHMDYVYWSSKQSALKAQELSNSSPICQPVFEAIDMSSIAMYHFSSVNKYISE